MLTEATCNIPHVVFEIPSLKFCLCVFLFTSQHPQAFPRATSAEYKDDTLKEIRLDSLGCPKYASNILN